MIKRSFFRDELRRDCRDDETRRRKGDEPSNYVDEKEEMRQYQRCVERKINKGTSLEMKERKELSK